MAGTTSVVYAGTEGASLPLATDTRGGLIYQRVLAGPCPATASACTNVASSATSVTLLATNAERLGVVIHNDSVYDLRVKFGGAASATSYSYLVPAGGTWEMANPVWVGVIDGIWAAAGGTARITELT